MVELIGSQWRPPIWRVIAAFIAGTFAGSLVFLLAMRMTQGPMPSIFFWTVAAGIMLINYFSAVVFGIPLYILLRRWVWSRWWVSVVAGALLALVVLTSLSVLSIYMAESTGTGSRAQLNAVNLLRSLSACLAAGAAGGMVFWLVGSFGDKRRSLASAEIFA